jgi:hypothetical protein
VESLKNSSKTPNPPGFHAQAGPPTKKFITLLVSSIQLSIVRFLGDHFNRPGLPVDRFSIVKQHFFINTNNVKGFFIAAARVLLLFEAY